MELLTCPPEKPTATTPKSVGLERNRLGIMLVFILKVDVFYSLRLKVFNP